MDTRTPPMRAKEEERMKEFKKDFLRKAGAKGKLQTLGELEQDIADYKIVVKAWTKKGAELESALEKYGRHLRDCKLHRADYIYRHPRNCTCGLEQALKGGD